MVGQIWFIAGIVALVCVFWGLIRLIKSLQNKDSRRYPNQDDSADRWGV